VNEDGEEELITPWLDDGCILPGITRLSVIELCKSWGEFKVTEQAVKLAPLLKASKEGRLLECFGTGTAAVIQPVKSLTYEGKEYTLPIAATGEASGPIAMRVMQQLGDIQNGEVEHEWSHVID
jgi:branched-chain amino acid aminotransferase